MDNWESALSARDDLDQYGNNALGLFALALRFQIDDIHSVATESITDGNDDKKCDIVYINQDEGIAVVAQCYKCSGKKDAAPANKASDLNTAIAWLIQRPIEDLPKRLQSSARELRQAIEDGSIVNIKGWYIHNLPESDNVCNELVTVESTVKAAIIIQFPGKKITVSTKEVGKNTLEAWYTDALTPILINDEFDIPIQGGFEVSESAWKAYVTAIQAKFLYRVYKKHKTRLFSANIRDYLGSRRSDANINYGIRCTAESDPGNFWVFNNGLTILVNQYTPSDDGKMKTIKVKGLSIVNGAQTTGALGSLKKSPDINVFVPVRFIQTTDSEIIHNIIQFNNSQNKVTASDFRSTDRIQKRLRDQIRQIPDAEYEGGRRGGHADIIRRSKKLLPSYTVGQALAAIHQDPVIAYNQKSNIWVSDKLYSKYFNDETTGSHIVFAYSLLRAVEAKKLALVEKSKKGEDFLTNQEKSLLDHFRHRGSTYLLVSAIGSCLETFLGRKVPNLFRISFGDKSSPKQAQQIWSPIVDATSPFCQQLVEAFTDGLKNTDRVQKAIQTFQSLVQATVEANTKIYAEFAKNISSKGKS
jgi:hypothetical protein